MSPGLHTTCMCVCVCVFVPAYKPRIYPWLNTDEARIFDKARTAHFVFSLDHTYPYTTPSSLWMCRTKIRVWFFFFFSNVVTIWKVRENSGWIRSRNLKAPSIAIRVQLAYRAHARNYSIALPQGKAVERWCNAKNQKNIHIKSTECPFLRVFDGMCSLRYMASKSLKQIGENRVLVWLN